MLASRQNGRFRSSRTRLAAVTAAAGAAVAIAAGPAIYGTTTAAAAPGVHPAAAQTPFGSSRLLQSEDFRGTGAKPPVQLDVETVYLHGGQALSACTGEMTMFDITGTDVDIDAGWRSQRIPGHALSENVSRASTAAKAKKFAGKITRGLQDCARKNEPKSHWYYGPAYTAKVAGGSITWRIAHDGTRHHPASGAVAVVRKGSYFGIVELDNDISGHPGKTVKMLGTQAIKRFG